jgi:hypothetical protein
MMTDQVRYSLVTSYFYCCRGILQISLCGRYLCDQITQRDYLESLQNFKSPLEHTLMLGDLGTH